MALLFVVAGYALRGHAWAIAVTAAAASVFAALLTYAIGYLFCAQFGQLVGSETVVAKTSRGAVVRDSGAGAAADVRGANSPGGEAPP